VGVEAGRGGAGPPRQGEAAPRQLSALPRALPTARGRSHISILWVGVGVGGVGGTFPSRSSPGNLRL